MTNERGVPDNAATVGRIIGKWQVNVGKPGRSNVSPDALECGATLVATISGAQPDNLSVAGIDRLIAASGPSFKGGRMTRPARDPALNALLTPMTTAGGEQLRPPLLMTASWPDPEDTSPLRREARHIDGVMTYSVIHDLHRRTPSDVTADMLAAALRLAKDWEMAGAGFAMVADYGQGGSRAAAWSGKPADRAVDAIGRVRAARRALLGICDVIDHVVLANWAVKRWASRRECDEKVAKGFLIAALTVLAAHYEGAGGAED